ncbi:MAG: 23S rRNA (guanosine(2251)-2'-O)-methyltransferase RlmB [candidate division Zixibacteria bacterium]|nr:23S rRNA (guanosine(2251)-2'-O)-methyltransferase RlmB [candidate division Zixibacteria bacterium]
MQELTKEKLRQIYRLKTEKGRGKEEKFLIEGLRLCQEAFSSNWETELVLFFSEFGESPEGQKLLEGFSKKGIEIFRVKKKEIEKLADTETPQGIVAVVKKRKFTLSRDFLKEASLLLSLDNIRDPGNLGTMIRTADAAGADGVLLSKGCVELYNTKVVRSTMGSLFHLPVIEGLDLKEVLPEMKVSGFKIFSSEVHKGKDHTKISYPEKICLLIGSEASGVRKEVSNLADEKIKIPIFGKAESLNASVAAGVLLYEIVRNKKGTS